MRRGPEAMVRSWGVRQGREGVRRCEGGIVKFMMRVCGWVKRVVMVEEGAGCVRRRLGGEDGCREVLGSGEGR